MNYTGFITAKNGSPVPVRGAVCFHSTYNPEREGERFAAPFADGSSFFVVPGVCGGYHLAALARRFPRATIIAVEETDDDIDFLSPLPCVQYLRQSPRVIITTTERLAHTLLQHFVPAEHTALQVAVLRAWEDTFPAQATAIKTILSQTLAVISADYSVQSHFGSIWQRNILLNLRHAAKQDAATLTFPTEKTAAIIAAGPTLDKTWRQLAQKRDAYYIIATDTGYRALLRRGIASDAVICTDAQMVSHAHFFALAPQTLCVFDLDANPATARHATGRQRMLFVQTGHPLAAFADNGTETFPPISAGSGTVTVAAASFAIRAGFSRIRFFGADFCYADGKAYAKGTYLDDLYQVSGNRLNPAEQQFVRLLFRTELQDKGNGLLTTGLLESYKNSLESLLDANNFKKNADNVYIRQGDFVQGRHTPLAVRPFDYDAFRRAYRQSLDETIADGINRNTGAFLTLLPYIAWLKTHQNQQDFESLVRRAYTKMWESV